MLKIEKAIAETMAHKNIQQKRFYRSRLQASSTIDELMTGLLFVLQDLGVQHG